MFTIRNQSDAWPGLSKLIEECGEVIQVCGKLAEIAGARHHWDGSDLKERLETEIADLSAAIEFVIEFCDLDSKRITHHKRVKAARFRSWRRGEEVDRWHGYQQEHADGSKCVADSPHACGRLHLPRMLFND